MGNCSSSKAKNKKEHSISRPSSENESIKNLNTSRCLAFVTEIFEQPEINVIKYDPYGDERADEDNHLDVEKNVNSNLDMESLHSSGNLIHKELNSEFEHKEDIDKDCDYLVQIKLEPETEKSNKIIRVVSDKDTEFETERSENNGNTVEILYPQSKNTYFVEEVMNKEPPVRELKRYPGRYYFKTDEKGELIVYSISKPLSEFKELVSVRIDGLSDEQQQQSDFDQQMSIISDFSDFSTTDAFNVSSFNTNGKNLLIKVVK